jgi:hypothetical protein
MLAGQNGRWNAKMGLKRGKFVGGTVPATVQRPNPEVNYVF